MKKILITGATGFIGRNLIERLKRNGGVEIIAVDRNWRSSDTDNSIFDGVEKVELNASDFCHLTERIKHRDIDTFFHLAWSGVNGTDKKDYRIQLSNSMAACEAVESAAEMGCNRFVFVGSADEYEFDEMPDARFHPYSHSKIYGISKYAAEVIGKIMASKSEIEFVSALLTLTYGCGNRTNVLPNMIIRNTLANKPISLIKGDNYFDMIYIDEAVKGIITVAEQGIDKESYYIGHADLKTFKNTVLDICRALGSSIELRFGEYPDVDDALDYSKIDRTKLYRDTGYVCDYPLEKGIRQTYDWLKNVESW
jgi:nucleoside-diphosphate-sugar epimerase